MLGAQDAHHDEVSQPPAAQGSHEQARCVLRGVLVRVHFKTGAADAVAVGGSVSESSMSRPLRTHYAATHSHY